MFVPSNQCKVCQTIAIKPRLKNEIFGSTFYIKTSSTTLLDIQKKYLQDFSYDSLRAHVKRHQGLTATQISKRNLKAIQEKQTKAIQYETAKSADVWNLVIKTGMQKLEDGELEFKTSDLLKATKDKSDYELKVKDQELAMAEMVAHFASGEGDLTESRKYDRRVVTGQTVTDYDPTDESSEDIDRRTEQSSAFYQSLIGDAATSGTD